MNSSKQKQVDDACAVHIVRSERASRIDWVVAIAALAVLAAAALSGVL